MFAVIAGPWLLEAVQASSQHVPHRDGFLPHGFCYLWNRPLLWTHLTSDLLIGVSYVVISFALAALVHRARRDIPFSVIFVAFGLFIITCGMTHFRAHSARRRPPAPGRPSSRRPAGARNRRLTGGGRRSTPTSANPPAGGCVAGDP